MKTYRHGDISLHPVEKIEGDVISHNGSFILAEGEHTGHKHVITTPRIEDMTITRTKDGGYMLELKAEGTITHQEHRTIKVKPGKYLMKMEQEFDYALGEVRIVQD